MGPRPGVLAGTVAAVALTSACLDAPPSATAPPGEDGGPGAPVRRLSGSYHTRYAIRSGGALFGWGAGDAGQLGDGLAADQPIAVAVLDGDGEPLTGVLAATGGVTHGCAVLADRQVTCWGSNGTGQLGDGGTATRLRAETRVIGVENAALVTANGPHSCALGVEGAVWCWGRNDNGELGEGGTAEEFLEAVAWLDGGDAIADATDVAAGFHHTCTVRTGGQVWCAGLNASGQLGRYEGEPFECTRKLPRALELADDAYLEGATQVSGGVALSCAIVGEEILCWGDPRCGQLGDGAGDAPCVDRSDEQCDDEGSSSPVQVDLAAVAPCRPVQVGAGDDFACALCAEGQVACWGKGAVGQLGNGETTASLRPVPVVDIEGAVEIAVGRATACALLGGTDQVYCWGQGAEGQLGNGATGSGVTSPVPVEVSGLPP